MPLGFCGDAQSVTEIFRLAVLAYCRPFLLVESGFKKPEDRKGRELDGQKILEADGFEGGRECGSLSQGGINDNGGNYRGVP
jgi:hypothetical protein